MSVEIWNNITGVIASIRDGGMFMQLFKMVLKEIIISLNY